MSRWEPWFTNKELACRCCGEVHMDEPFMAKLVNFRRRTGIIMPVTSGFRCPQHNLAVSDTGLAGPHTTGKAVDILIAGEMASLVLRDAFSSGFLGIGAMQHGDWSKRMLHLDMLPRPFQTFWTY